jgi:hypothetical protein
MEENVNPWKANLSNGLVMGLIGVIITLVIWAMDLTFNKVSGFIYPVVTIFALYYMIKSYRDNFLHGRITYGQSVGAGVIIFIYASVVTAVFAYLLYKVIDPDLTNKILAYTEEQIRKTGRVPENAMDSAMSLQRKIMKPEITAPLSLITSIFQGTIISLIVSIFTKKEGNPLLATPEEK